MQGLQGAIVKTGGRPASDVEDDSDSLDTGELVHWDTTAPLDNSQNPDNQTLLRLLHYGENLCGPTAFLLLDFLCNIGSLAIFITVVMATTLLNLLDVLPNKENCLESDAHVPSVLYFVPEPTTDGGYGPGRQCPAVCGGEAAVS